MVAENVTALGRRQSVITNST